MYFTERSQEFINEIFAYMNRELRSINNRIAKAEEKGKTDRVERLTSQRDNMLSEYKNVHKEISALANSDQGYDVFIDNSLQGGSNDQRMLGMGSEGGRTFFNKENGLVEISLSSKGETGILAHELKHAYDFETGNFSLRFKDESSIKRGEYLGFADQTDETIAFERGKFFGQKNSAEDYSKLPASPINFNNEFYQKRLRTLKSEQHNLFWYGQAKAFRQALRVNGKTYY